MKERLRNDRARLESLLKISQYHAKSTRDLLDFALNEAITLTQSAIGYIYFYNEKTRRFTLNTWSKSVMEVCTIMEPQTDYDLDKTGLWGEAVRQKRPVVVNDFAAPNPLKKGYPEGHASLQRFMTIPVISDGSIVAVLGLANKRDAYDDGDVQQATLMMSAVWQIAERKRVEDELQRYRDFIVHISDGCFEVDLKGDITFANEAMAKHLGYSPRQMIGMNNRDYTSPAEAKRIFRIFNRVYQTGQSATVNDCVVISSQGLERHVEMSVSLIRDDKGNPIGFRGTTRDISEERTTEEALRQSEERNRLLFNNIPVPTLVWKAQDDQFILTEFNEEALRFIGDGIVDLVGKNADPIFARIPQVKADIQKCMTSRKVVDNQFWYDPGGHLEKRYIIVKYAWTPPDSVLMHVNDITGQKRAEENLQYISVHDSLTGLYNRFYADAEIDRMADSRLRPISIIIIDLDDLKKINDEYGHASGDLYIKNAAAILKQTFRPDDMIARIGGDEFLVLLPLVDEDTCARAMVRLDESIRAFNKDREQPVYLSGGNATAHAGCNLKERVREADRDMYLQKADKKKRLRAHTYE